VPRPAPIEAAAPRGRSPLAPAGTAEQPEPARGVVLVVDDSPTVLKVVSYELKKHRLEVVTAPNGPEALEILKTLLPDLVLLDINMPFMDGYQVCRAIRANERTSRIPVVMLSGKDGFFDKIRGRLAGAAEYITKPFEPPALLAMLEKYVPVRL
jgi:twitching motility two-component system response regulator PilG